MSPNQVKKKIQSNLDQLKSLAGAEVNESALTKISKTFCNILGMTSGQSIGLVYQSCLHLLYTTPDETTLIETFRKVAANADYIWKGFSIPVWKGEPVNVSIGVARAAEEIYKGTRISKIYFRVLSGLPAGLLLEISAPSWWVCKIIRRKLGLWRTHLSIHSSDIAGTKFSVRLSIKEDKVVWDNISATKKQKDENKELINARYDERPCGLPFPCHKCPSTRRQCRLAVL